MSTPLERQEAYYDTYQFLGDAMEKMPYLGSPGYEAEGLLNAEASLLSAANNALVTLLDTLAALTDLTKEDEAR